MKALAAMVALVLLAGLAPAGVAQSSAAGTASTQSAGPAKKSSSPSKAQPNKAQPNKSQPAKRAAPRTTRGKSKATPKARERLELDWKEMLPAKDRKKFRATAPPPVHDYLGEGGAPAVQTLDFNVNKELDGVRVKLPGFIVPLAVGKDGLVREFFLVPYFGACIHVPPPPPNQMVYVRSSKPVALDTIYEAHWVTGKMRVETKTTKLGAAAYALTAEKIEVYKY